MEFFKLINGETGETMRFVNNAQIERGEFTTELFCGNKIVAVRPADLSDTAAEAARSEFVAAAHIVISRLERSGSKGVYPPRTGSQEEANLGNAEIFTAVLGRMIESESAEFWIANRTGYPDRVERVLREQGSRDFSLFPKFVRQ